jgi:hypothetical protein
VFETVPQSTRGRRHRVGTVVAVVLNLIMPNEH